MKSKKSQNSLLVQSEGILLFAGYEQSLIQDSESWLGKSVLTSVVGKLEGSAVDGVAVVGRGDGIDDGSDVGTEDGNKDGIEEGA